MGITISEALKLQSRSKYRNRRIVVDGETFDSKREAQRWYELKLLRRAGVVTDLQRQVPFVLIPEQKYIIKRKLMLWVRGIRVQEV